MLLIKREFCCANLSPDGSPSLLFGLHLHAMCDSSLLSSHNSNDPVLFQLKSKLFMNYFVYFQESSQ